MKQEDFKNYAPIEICFSLLNYAREYVKNEEQAIPILTQLINHIATITTRDFQIKEADLKHPKQPCIAVAPNILIEVLWNYSSHFLNILHPQYQHITIIEQQTLLEQTDIIILHKFLNYIAIQNQIEYEVTKEELYKRIYDIQKQYTKRL